MHDKIPVKFTKMAPEAVTPSHGRFGDAGYDLSSLEDVILEPFERKLIKTGIAIELPLGFAALVIPRSGNAINKGLSLEGAVVLAQVAISVLASPAYLYINLIIYLM